MGGEGLEGVEVKVPGLGPGSGSGGREKKGGGVSTSK